MTKIDTSPNQLIRWVGTQLRGYARNLHLAGERAPTNLGASLGMAPRSRPFPVRFARNHSLRIRLLLSPALFRPAAFVAASAFAPRDVLCLCAGNDHTCVYPRWRVGIRSGEVRLVAAIGRTRSRDRVAVGNTRGGLLGAFPVVVFVSALRTRSGLLRRTSATC